MGNWSAWLRRACLAAVAALLSSCGGGGGGGGSGGGGGTGGGGGGGPLPSMVPAPGPLGAVLAIDALQLRPLTSGATWTYRGRATRFPGDTPALYSNVATQTSQAGGFNEQSTNAFNTGAFAMPIASTSGSVLSDGDIELRSPVQQNDQFTLLEEHVANIGIDVDGDGRNDSGDVAIYRVVVGVEPVTPENLPALQAVRVDTVGLSRITITSNGSTTPAVEVARQSTWYVAGIGIVHQRFTSLNAAGSEQVADETIASFDGLTQGFGALPPVLAAVPASSATNAGVALRGNFSFVGAARFADHALVFTQKDISGPGTMVSRIDKRGNALGTQELATRLTTNGRVVGLATGALYVEPVNALAVQATLTRFDPNGNLIGTVAGKTLELGGGRFNPVVGQLQAVGDGDTLWIVWSRSFVQFNPSATITELVLGTFDADGNATAPEAVIDSSTVFGELFSPSISAQSGTVLLTWKKTTGINSTDSRYALARATPSSAAGVSLATVGGTNVFVVPVALDQGGVLTWRGTFGIGANLPLTPAVRITDAGAVLRSEIALDAELVAGTQPVDLFGNVLQPAGVGNRVVFSRSGRGSLWIGDSQSSSQLIDWVTWLDADQTTPLATLLTRSVRAGSGGAYAQIVWPDRVLLFGGSDFQLTTRVVWLNAGS
jgi:hypothetical protein